MPNLKLEPGCGLASPQGTSGKFDSQDYENKVIEKIQEKYIGMQVRNRRLRNTSIL